MKNVLFSLEKLKRQQELLSNIRKSFDNMQIAIGKGDAIEAKEYKNDMYFYADSIRELQDIPDFVESEEDVIEIASVLNDQECVVPFKKRDRMCQAVYISTAQAAINALQYKGGE